MHLLVQLQFLLDIFFHSLKKNSRDFELYIGLRKRLLRGSLERSLLTTSLFLSNALSANKGGASPLLPCFFFFQHTNPAHEKTYPKRLCSHTNSKQGQAFGEFIFSFQPSFHTKEKKPSTLH